MALIKIIGTHSILFCLIGIAFLFLYLEYIQETHNYRMKRIGLLIGFFYCFILLIHPIFLQPSKLDSIVFTIEVLDQDITLYMLINFLSYIPLGLLFVTGMKGKLKSFITLLIGFNIALLASILSYFMLLEKFEYSILAGNILGCMIGILLAKYLEIKYRIPPTHRRSFNS